MFGIKNQPMLTRPLLSRVTLVFILIISAVLMLIFTVKANSVSAARAVALVPPTASNVPYGTDPKQVMDVYAAPASQLRPAVVVVHGGGWSRGDKSERGIANVASQLAENGFAVFNINYRLATDAKPGYTMQPADLRLVTAWIQQNGAQYGADTTNINFVGGSAGAHLVSYTSQLMNQEVPGTIRSVVSFSGPMDFLAAMHPADGTVVSDTAEPGVNKYMGCKPSVCTDQQYIDQSPYYKIDPATCPAFLIINSTNEVVPLDQAQSMHDKLIENSCDSTLKVYTGTQHAFRLFNATESQVVEFLNR